jgi:hypothetical protein
VTKLPLLQVGAQQQTFKLTNYILVSLTSQLLTNQIVLVTVDQQHTTVAISFAFLSGQELPLLYSRHVLMVVLLLKDKLLSNGVPWKNTEPLGPLASLQYGLSPENESNHLDWLFLAIDNLSRLINSNLTQLEQRLNDNDTGLA